MAENRRVFAQGERTQLIEGSFIPFMSADNHNLVRTMDSMERSYQRRLR